MRTACEFVYRPTCETSAVNEIQCFETGVEQWAHSIYVGVGLCKIKRPFLVTHLLYVKACSNEADMLVQHHPTLLDATCWPRLNSMLEDVGLILNLLKISSNIMQHCWGNNVA